MEPPTARGFALQFPYNRRAQNPAHKIMDKAEEKSPSCPDFSFLFPTLPYPVEGKKRKKIQKAPPYK